MAVKTRRFWGDRAAGAVIQRACDGKVFLMRRSADVEGGGWGFPGGKVDQGKDVMSTLHGEVVEETGSMPEGRYTGKKWTYVTKLNIGDVVFSDEDMDHVGELTHADGSLQYYEIVEPGKTFEYEFHHYLMTDDDWEPEVNWESDGYEWFSPDELPSKLFRTSDERGNVVDTVKMAIDKLAKGYVPKKENAKEQVAEAASSKTDSQAFKTWFGSSKVVDAKGNPLRVFHGTAETFTKFGKYREKGWHYFSDSHEFAGKYSDSEKPIRDLGQWKSCKVQMKSGSHDAESATTSVPGLILVRYKYGEYDYLDVFQQSTMMRVASIHNHEEDMDEAEDVINELGKTGVDWTDENLKNTITPTVGAKVRSAIKNGRDISSARMFSYKSDARGYGVGSQVMAVYLKIENPLDMRSLPARKVSPKALKEFLEGKNITLSKDMYLFSGRDLYQVLNSPEFSKELRAQAIERGYDGVVFKDFHDAKTRGTSYIAFYPEQIKSATGNKGKFSSDREDIRESTTKGMTLGEALDKTTVEKIGRRQASVVRKAFPGYPVDSSVFVGHRRMYHQDAKFTEAASDAQSVVFLPYEDGSHWEAMARIIYVHGSYGWPSFVVDPRCRDGKAPEKAPESQKLFFDKVRKIKGVEYVRRDRSKDVGEIVDGLKATGVTDVIVGGDGAEEYAAKLRKAGIVDARVDPQFSEKPSVEKVRPKGSILESSRDKEPRTVVLGDDYRIEVNGEEKRYEWRLVRMEEVHPDRQFGSSATILYGGNMYASTYGDKAYGGGVVAKGEEETYEAAVEAGKKAAAKDREDPDVHEVGRKHQVDVLRTLYRKVRKDDKLSERDRKMLAKAKPAAVYVGTVEDEPKYEDAPPHGMVYVHDPSTDDVVWTVYRLEEFRGEAGSTKLFDEVRPISDFERSSSQKVKFGLVKIGSGRSKSVEVAKTAADELADKDLRHPRLNPKISSLKPEAAVAAYEEIQAADGVLELVRETFGVGERSRWKSMTS